MKRKDFGKPIGILLVSIFCFSFAANTAISETQKIPVKSSNDSVKTSSRASVKKESDERTKNQERLLSIVTERADLLNSRWQALAHRFDRLAERVDSLLLKLEKNNVDTTTARSLFDTASTKINDARGRSVEAYVTIVARAGESNGTASDLYLIEKDFVNPEKKAVAEAFREARSSLLNVILALPANN